LFTIAMHWFSCDISMHVWLQNIILYLKKRPKPCMHIWIIKNK
jgi:hypothetical protein